MSEPRVPGLVLSPAASVGDDVVFDDSADAQVDIGCDTTIEEQFGFARLPSLFDRHRAGQ